MLETHGLLPAFGTFLFLSDSDANVRIILAHEYLLTRSNTGVSGRLNGNSKFQADVKPTWRVVLWFASWPCFSLKIEPWFGRNSEGEALTATQTAGGCCFQNP
ncbi:hypothetical protein BJX76DRAFT_308568 [Aspergillus varians]